MAGREYLETFRVVYVDTSTRFLCSHCDTDPRFQRQQRVKTLRGIQYHMSNCPVLREALPGGLIENGLVNEVEVVPNNEDGDAEANDGGHDLGEFGEVLPRDEGGVAELSEVRHDANEDGSPVVNEAERVRRIKRSNAIRRLN